MGNSSVSGVDERKQTNQEECKDGNINDNPAHAKSTIGSQSSRGRRINLKKTFCKEIQKQCNCGNIPPLQKVVKWFVFSWENKLSHECVVLGVQDPNDHNKLHPEYGFITMELGFNETTKKVFPHAKYYSVTNAMNENYYQHESILPKYNNEDVKNRCKWKLYFKTPAIKLIDFRNLTLNLIKKHGEYDKVLNNCSDFVFAFFAKTYYSMRHKQQLQQNQCYHSKLQNDQVYQKYKDNTNVIGVLYEAIKKVH